MVTSASTARRNAYERSDASPRGLVYFALIMAAILAAVSLSLIFLFKHLEKVDNPGSFVPAPFAAERPIPPRPRVQPNPGADMQSYYESQQQILNRYAWIDRKKGIVRLPIDRAMQLLLQRGLPTRSPDARQNPPPPNRANDSAGKSRPGGGTR
jgi:hypothetical protein